MAIIPTPPRHVQIQPDVDEGYTNILKRRLTTAPSDQAWQEIRHGGLPADPEIRVCYVLHSAEACIEYHNRNEEPGPTVSG